MILRGNRGFTLLELLITMVIIAVLAGAAYPIYLRSVTRARESEGWTFLGAIRGSELRYYTEHDEIFTNNLLELDIDDPQALAVSPYFNYCVRPGEGGPPAGFIAVAEPVPDSGCAGCQRLCIDHLGQTGQGVGAFPGNCPGC